LSILLTHNRSYQEEQKKILEINRQIYVVQKNVLWREAKLRPLQSKGSRNVSCRRALQPTPGKVLIEARAKIEYLTQHQLEQLDPDGTPLQTMVDLDFEAFRKEVQESRESLGMSASDGTIPKKKPNVPSCDAAITNETSTGTIDILCAGSPVSYTSAAAAVEISICQPHFTSWVTFTGCLGGKPGGITI
jgi:hypothetical protein